MSYCCPSNSDLLFFPVRLGFTVQCCAAVVTPAFLLIRMESVHLYHRDAVSEVFFFNIMSTIILETFPSLCRIWLHHLTSQHPKYSQVSTLRCGAAWWVCPLIPKPPSYTYPNSQLDPTPSQGSSPVWAQLGGLPVSSKHPGLEQNAVWNSWYSYETQNQQPKIHTQVSLQNHKHYDKTTNTVSPKTTKPIFSNEKHLLDSQGTDLERAVVKSIKELKKVKDTKKQVNE